MRQEVERRQESWGESCSNCLWCNSLMVYGLPAQPSELHHWFQYSSATHIKLCSCQAGNKKSEVMFNCMPSLSSPASSFLSMLALINSVSDKSALQLLRWVFWDLSHTLYNDERVHRLEGSKLAVTQLMLCFQRDLHICGPQWFDVSSFTNADVLKSLNMKFLDWASALHTLCCEYFSEKPLTSTLCGSG